MAQTTNLKSIKGGPFQTTGLYPIVEAIDSDGNSIDITNVNNMGATGVRKVTWDSSTGTFQLTISELNINVGGSTSTIATQFDAGKYVLVINEYK
jgi:hypothetical protein